MTRRLTIIGLVAAAIVFVGTLTQPPRSTALWPPLVAAVVGAAATFFYIWFLFPLIAWIGSVVVSRFRRALAHLARPE